MAELRQAPAKPDPRFWDAEARKLMLMQHKAYLEYATGLLANGRPTKLDGSFGLRWLGFRRRLADGGKPRKHCPIVKLHGKRLTNACRRLYKELNK